MTDTQLDQLLKSCGARHAPPRFHSDVWNRIAAEPDCQESPTSWSRLLADTFDRLSRPTAAFATCAIFATAGTLIGIGTRPDSTPPDVQYIQSVSPFHHQSGK